MAEAIAHDVTTRAVHSCPISAVPAEAILFSDPGGMAV
jgi:hypothetical protein